MTTEVLDAILEQIREKPAFIDAALDRYDRHARQALDFQTGNSVHQLIVTGSGDSYAAGLATRLAFHRYARVPMQALKAMDAARYVIPFLPRPRHTLFVGISYSGSAARTNEALQMAKEAGMMTLAMTGNPRSDFAQNADSVMDLSFAVTSPPGTPGIHSFLASQLGLLLLAFRIGEITHRLTTEQAGKLRDAIRQVGSHYQTFFKETDSVAARFVGKGEINALEFLGSGPSFGTAVFSAAKVVEIAGVQALAEDIEEFHHFQFFETARPLPVVLYAPSGNAYSRAVEIAHEVQKLERTLLAVVQEGDDVIPSVADFTFRLPDHLTEPFAPLIMSSVGELLAYHLGRAHDAVPFRGFQGVWEGDALSYSGIRSSRKVSNLEELR